MKGKRNHVKRQVAGSNESADDSARSLQRSRKGTKAWRKNIDIDEVTSGLEKVRQQKIQGGIIHEKPNEQLFAVDTTGDSYVLNRERLTKRLRSDEILALKSAIAPVSGFAHKNSALGAGIVHKKKKGALPPSELRRLKKIANRLPNATNGSNAIATITKDVPKEYDVWDVPMMTTEITSEWVEPPQKKRPPVTYGQAPEVLTSGRQALPAIEVAEEGQSYNPPMDEWNDLIQRKAQEQVKLDSLQALQNAKNRAAQAKDERFEMETFTADKIGSADEEYSEGEEEEDDVTHDISTSRRPSARATAKTQAQRNKELKRQRQLAIEAAIRHRKAERKAYSTLSHHPSGPSDLTVSHPSGSPDPIASLSSSSARAAAAAASAHLRRHKFGRHAMPPAPLDIHLSDDLTDSLRTLRPQGNLFRDRFTSLVRRGVVESRVPVPKRRRYALVKREKYSHKFDRGVPFMS